jgi:hypothetical protein
MNQVTPALQDALVPNSVIVGLNTAIRNLEQSIAQQRGFQAISWQTASPSSLPMCWIILLRSSRPT